MITHAGKLWATVPLYHYGIQDKIPNMLKSGKNFLSRSFPTHITTTVPSRKSWAITAVRSRNSTRPSSWVID